MQFDYLYQLQPTGCLDIENIGEFALCGYNVLYQYFILIVHTVEGNTKVIEYGPIFVDIEAPPTKIIYNFTQFDYSMSKIVSIVKKWLNGTNQLTQVEIITLDEAKAKIKELVNFI